MKNKFMNLHIFEEGGNGGEGNTAGQNGNSGNGNGSQSGSAGYTFEQAEEIANNRAEKASRAALASFYRQQGLSEEQITTAIADFKAKQKAQQPDVDALTKERDQAQKELQELKNEKILTGKGVKADDLDYVMFKVNKLVDDKTDFAKAAEKFLKENPKYAGAGTYRVSTSTGSDNQDTGGSVNMNINDRIRAAARR
nr:MAG TPA: Major head protein [Caudoviricetes sp.]